MLKDCSQYWEGMIRIAKGQEDSLAEKHLESCRDCKVKLAQIKQILEAGSRNFFNAPESDIERAVALMPKRERRLATLIRSSLSQAGARGVREDFQLLVGLGSTQLRIMYSQTQKGWEVRGRLPSTGWRIEYSQIEAPLGGDGGFVFDVPNLAKSGFVVVGPDGATEVPPAEELLGTR